MTKISFCKNVNNLWIIFLLQFSFTSTHSHLVANYSSVKFPTFSHGDRIYYDGQNDVYLFKDNSLVSTNIFRYSLSTNKINSLGSVYYNTAYGSIQSDLDGNILYFGADLQDNKVLKYSPSTNSTSVVAQLPHDIYGVPTIKLDNTVLILGRYRDGLEILSFDLLENKATLLENQLPVSIRYGSAIKFGKDKAYLFPTNGSMWELDLPTMTFNLIPNITLPNPVFPSLMTDGTFIYVMTDPDHGGIFQIDPVTMTTDFIHVENLPSPPNDFLPAVYIPKMKGIFGLTYPVTAHQTDVQEDKKGSEMFFIDLSPLLRQDGNQLNSEVSTTQTLTLETTASKVSPLVIKFACCSSLQGSKSLTCSLSDNQTTSSSIIDVCYELRLSQNVNCNRVSPSAQEHDDDSIILIPRPSSRGDDCGFLMDSFLDEIENILDCHLENGILLSLTFFRGELETTSIPYIVFVLLLIVGVVVVLVTGWVMVKYGKKKKGQINHVVFWDADKDCETIE